MNDKISKILPGHTVIGNKRIESIMIPSAVNLMDGDNAKCCRAFVVAAHYGEGSIPEDLVTKYNNKNVRQESISFFESLVYLGQFKDHYYTCTQLDRDKGVCKIYDKRPPICRRYGKCEYINCKTSSMCSVDPFTTPLSGTPKCIDDILEVEDYYNEANTLSRKYKEAEEDREYVENIAKKLDQDYANSL